MPELWAERTSALTIARAFEWRFRPGAFEPSINTFATASKYSSLSPRSDIIYSTTSFGLLTRLNRKANASEANRRTCCFCRGFPRSGASWSNVVVKFATSGRARYFRSHERVLKAASITLKSGWLTVTHRRETVLAQYFEWKSSPRSRASWTNMLSINSGMGGGCTLIGMPLPGCLDERCIPPARRRFFLGGGRLGGGIRPGAGQRDRTR